MNATRVRIEHERGAATGDHALQPLPELLGVGEIELSRESEDDDLRIVGAVLLELELNHLSRRHDWAGIVKSRCLMWRHESW